MTYGSLFSGIGGIDLGLDRAGFTCRWQVEIEPYAVRVLEKHWPNVPRYGDIRKLTGAELEPVDLICGGYPCQPFSQAGKRAGESDPRHLWPEFARIIRVLRPRYVLLENVPGHLSLGFGTVLGDLAGLGYDAEWTCLRASDFGASHIRKRVFVVGYRLENAEHAGSSFPRSKTRGEAETNNALRPSGGPLAYGERSRCDGSAGQGLRVDGSPLQPARPCGGDGHLANTGCECLERREPQWERVMLNGECGDSSRTLADPGDGQLSQQGRGAAGRDGVGPAGAVLSDASEPGLSDSERQIRHGETRNGQGPATTELCGAFAPGPSDPRWPAILREYSWLAPALGGRLNPRFVCFLMGFPIGFTEIQDANEKTTGRSTEARSDAERLPETDIAPEEIELRTVRGKLQAAHVTPQGSKLAKFRPREHPNAVLHLSHLVASCERRDSSESERAALSILQAPDIEAICLQYLSDADKALWETTSRDDKAALLIEAGTAVRAMSNRTKRLKALGNAVVPACAEWIGRRILQCDPR